MIKLLLLIILFFSVESFSQDSTKISEVDSLLNEAFDLRWSNPLETVLISSKALEISKSSDYKLGIVKSYGFMGVGYENLSMLEEALNSYLKGLEIADSLKLDEEIGFSYNNLASYYINLENYDLANEYLYKGLKIALKINNDRLLGYIYRNLSLLNRRKKEFEKALEYAKKSLEFRERANNEEGIITSLRELLVIYFNKNDFVATENILNRLYSLIGNREKYKLQLARIKRTEAEILQAKKKYKESLSVFDESLALFKSINNLEGIIRIYKLKSELNYSIGKFKDAYDNIIQHNAYVDSLNKIRSLQRISLIETNYKNKQLQNELLLASEELKQRNIILLSLFIGFVILGFAAYLTHKSNKEKKKLIKQISEQNKILEEDNEHKQKLLSIIGHDIKNPFSSVYSISDFLINNSNSIGEEELKNYLILINRSVKNGLNLLDNLLIWSMNIMGKLNYNFVDLSIRPIINNTLELYNSNIQEKNLKVLVNISDELVFADKNSVEAIIRNLVNNAIKFSNNDGQIKIETDILDNYLKVKVIDNGKGLTKDEIDNILNNEKQIKSESSTGLGLQIVKDFVKINQGELFIKSIPNKETEFSFTLRKSNQ